MKRDDYYQRVKNIYSTNYTNYTTKYRRYFHNNTIPRWALILRAFVRQVLRMGAKILRVELLNSPI